MTRVRRSLAALSRIGRWLRSIPRVVRRWLTSEIVRGLIATFIGAPVGAWLADPLFVHAGDLGQAMGTAFGAWSGFALCHALVTWLALRKREGDDLREALRVGEGWERTRSWWWFLGTDGPAWSVGIAGTAMLAVGLLLGFKSVRGTPMLLTAGLLTLASWLDVMITFAALYARSDLGKTGPMLQFPDADRPRTFSDYVYVAITVMSTFGVSDAAVVHPRMRRLVATHSFIAFMFNTTIVAVLVSLVVTLAG